MQHYEILPAILKFWAEVNELNLSKKSQYLLSNLFNSLC